MNDPIDAGIAEFHKTIAMLGARLAQMALENAGLRAALAAERPERQKNNSGEAPEVTQRERG